MVNLEREKLDHILQLLKSIDYGSISIIVHDGQVTGIESTKKKRFSVEKKKLKTNQY